MKSIFFAISIAFCSLNATSAFAQSTSVPEKKGIENATLQVSGNCGMCKRRIEEACVLRGVKAAKWDATTGLLALTFDAQRTSLDRIATAIAAAGYDNDRAKSSGKAYEKLPKCCQYRAADAEKH